MVDKNADCGFANNGTINRAWSTSNVDGRVARATLLPLAAHDISRADITSLLPDIPLQVQTIAYEIEYYARLAIADASGCLGARARLLVCCIYPLNVKTCASQGGAGIHRGRVFWRPPRYRDHCQPRGT